MKKIYICGPYSSNPIANVDKAMIIANKIMDMGLIPYIPHLDHFWDLKYPRPWGDWIKYNSEWLLCCDALFRISGKSRGSDIEVDLAIMNDIPVFYSLKVLKKAILLGLM